MTISIHPPYVRLLYGLLATIVAATVGGCAPAVLEAVDPGPSPSAPASTPTTMPTCLPTPTVYPTPAPPPTPLPTIVIPMLTPGAPPTPQTELRTGLWQIPDRVIPEGYGVEIHFTRTSQQELDYLAAAGFRWVRMDMFWHVIERESGSYGFSEYDVLVNAMSQRGIRIVFILDYGNPLYDHGFPPTSPGGQNAYARFAAAAARHYRGDGIVWELWNEPNLDHFWTPEANATAYGQLALKAVTAIRRADPTALVVGPALAGFEWPYWHTLGQMGFFGQVDAVTVHPYGVLQPEGLIEPYLHLRALLDAYSPRWKVPILSGEWGFATTEGGWTDRQQAEYLTRQWLFNLSHDINLSIWYDWRDDGTDPHDPEQNFGTVYNDYTPKPSYLAARTLATTLGSHRFLRRIPLENPEDYLLLFEDYDSVAMVAWTTASPHIVILPITTDNVEIVEMTGKRRIVETEDEQLALPVTASPQYLLFQPHQRPSTLGGWRPADTINCLVAHESATLPIILDRHAPETLVGEFQVWIRGALRGSLPVAITPFAPEQVRVPVDLGGLSGNVRAEVRLILDDPEMAALQAALIWVQVTPP